MAILNGVQVNTDCIYFKGDIPCKPNKTEGYMCEGCPVYKPVSHRILIIKLGAIGDVIRTTPLLRKIKEVYPAAKITWLTHTPAILPQGEIDEILKLDFTSVL